jgi:hypothetical protein
MRFGIDLGGTKIAGIALDDAGAKRGWVRVDTPQGDYEGTVRAVAGVVADLERQTGTKGSVGVGMPGTIARARGLVKNANSVCLNGKPFDKDLAEAIGREVRCANDANCLAVSEATTACRGRGTRNTPARPATAENGAASRLGSPAPGWRPTTHEQGTPEPPLSRSPVGLRKARPKPSPRSSATRTGWRGPWSTWSTYWTRTSSCSAEACRT